MNSIGGLEMDEGTGSKKQTPAFLEKLFDILEDDSQYSDLISWQDDGVSFIIKRVNEFSEIVLPKYFKHSNIQSYIRQLNMYGFSKTRHDSNHREFTHQLFRRGRRDLLPLIKRKTQVNGNRSSGVDNLKLKAASNQYSGDIPYQSTIKVEQNSAEVRSQLPGRAESALNFSSTTLSKDADDSIDTADLEQRVEILESHLSYVLNRYAELSEKHNQLCTALHRMKTDTQSLYTSNKSARIRNTASDLAISRAVNADECGSSPSTQAPSSKQNRMGGRPGSDHDRSRDEITEPLPVATKKARTGELEGNCGTDASQSKSNNFDEEMQKYYKRQQAASSSGIDFSSFLVAQDSIDGSSPVNNQDGDFLKLNSFSSITSTVNRTSALSLSALPTDSHLPGRAFPGADVHSRSVSIELGGLHAITAAAHILDSGAKTPHGSTAAYERSTSRQQGDADASAGHAAALQSAAAGQSYALMNQRNGQPLSKSLSFG